MTFPFERSSSALNRMERRDAAEACAQMSAFVDDTCPSIGARRRKACRDDDVVARAAGSVRTGERNVTWAAPAQYANVARNRESKRASGEFMRANDWRACPDASITPERISKSVQPCSL